jgi:hypothetical protein
MRLQVAEYQVSALEWGRETALAGGRLALCRPVVRSQDALLPVVAPPGARVRMGWRCDDAQIVPKE